MNIKLMTTVKVSSVDGDEILSHPFSIDRRECGTRWHTVISTLYFILDLELVLKRHDKVINKGVNFGGRRVHALGYADDWTTTATRQPTE